MPGGGVPVELKEAEMKKDGASKVIEFKKSVAARVRKTDHPSEVKADETVGGYLQGCKAATVQTDKATEADLRRWLASQEADGRASTRWAYHVGRVLLHQRQGLRRGQVSEWEAATSKALEREPRTLTLYMSIAKALGEKTATPLPVSILDRPLREVPKAIRNFQAGRDLDEDAPRAALAPAQKVARWMKAAAGLIKQARQDPDLQVALADFIASLQGGTPVAPPDQIQQHVEASAPLVQRYAPRRFDEVVGNQKAVETMKELAKKKVARPFLIAGPSGTGKSTLAGLYARSFACVGTRLDGHDYCGVCTECKAIEEGDPLDQMLGREVAVVPAGAYPDAHAAVEAVIELLNAFPRPIVVDEADRLLIAQQRLFHRIETLKCPIFFTTVHPEKMDAQFRGRCTVVELERVEDDEVRRLLSRVAHAEGFDLAQANTNRILEMLKDRGASGQVRDALVLAEQVWTCNRAGGDQNVPGNSTLPEHES